MHQSRHRFRRSRRGALGALVGALLALGGAGALWILSAPVSIEAIGGWVELAGGRGPEVYLALGVSLLFLFYGLYRLRESRYSVNLDPAGLEDNALKIGPIAWRDVADLDLSTSDKGTFLTVWLAQSTAAARGQAKLTVDLTNLEERPAEVYEAALKLWKPDGSPKAR